MTCAGSAPRRMVAARCRVIAEDPPAVRDQPVAVQRRAGVEDERARRLGVLDPLDRRAAVGALGVVAGPASTTVTAASSEAVQLDARRGRRRAAAASAPSKSPSSRGRIDCVSGSPKRQLNSSTFGPSARQHQPGEEDADERRRRAARAPRRPACGSARRAPRPRRRPFPAPARRSPCRRCSGRCRRRRSA